MQLFKIDINILLFLIQSNRQRCAQATVPLLEAVDNLCKFAGSSEFISIPARISTQARRAQEPILDSGRFDQYYFSLFNLILFLYIHIFL